LHLMDILFLRTMPAAGLYLSLTRRCPLSCAHCSTNSMMSSEEQGAESLIRFVSTFTPSTRPDLVYLTGGEALLRPRLVRTITEICHAVGTKVCLLSGMFFAREDSIARQLDQTIAMVDHFTASLDIFHEQQVSRSAVLRVLRTFVDRGQDVSIQIAGLNENDAYLRAATNNIREYFADQVPMLVTYIKPIGRGKQWLSAQQITKRKHQSIATPVVEVSPSPCAVASWPVVTFNGSIVGCCNQDLVDDVDGEIAPHLQFGHVATSDWPSVHERYLHSTLMRAIRIFGPEYTMSQYGSGKETCDGYCSTCFKLSRDSEIPTHLQPLLARPTMQFVEEKIIQLQREHFVANYGASFYADLAQLGYASKEETEYAS